MTYYNKRRLLFVLVLVLSVCKVKSQVNPEIDSIQIGKNAPFMKFTDVHYFESSELTINDLKGKWTILDFWNEYCSSCIASFKHLDSLQKRYGERVKILLVGYTGSQYYKSRSSNKSIRTLYEKCRKIMNLNLPIAYDSLVFPKFGIVGCPYIIICTPDGIVSGITYRISSDNIEDLLAGRPAKFAPLSNFEVLPSYKYQPEIPFLTYENGGKDTSFLFRSVLSKWDPSISYFDPVNLVNGFGKFELLRASLLKLYRYAYFGKGYWYSTDSLYGNSWIEPVLRIKDSTKFIPDYNSGDNVYCYSLIVPQPRFNKKTLMNFMQRDLFNYFGFKCDVESKIMPCWKLVFSPGVKPLKTCGQTSEFEPIPNGGFRAVNITIQKLISVIWAANQHEPPFVDETSISTNIDIVLSCVMTDLKDINSALNDYGLALIKGERMMDVLIITEDN